MVCNQNEIVSCPRTLTIKLSDDDLAESFFVIPSGDEKRKLRKENAVLKAEISTLRNQLSEMNVILKMRQDKDNALRDNILHARREVHHMESRLGKNTHHIVRPNA
jgi:predicted  nucleic acid-binding Zn-ribbon protein